MKVLALFLMICMVTISALPGKAVAVKPELKRDCCHKPGKNTPCKPGNNDCSRQGTCNMLVCSNCGFLKVDPLTVSAAIPVIKETAAIPYNAGNLSDYSHSSWHPPKV